MIKSGADEYIIYGYAQYHDGAIGYNQWQYLAKNYDPRACYTQAREFLKSHGFSRIEIKKKSFDHKRQKYSLSTMAVLGEKKRLKKEWLFAASLLLISIIAFAAIQF